MFFQSPLFKLKETTTVKTDMAVHQKRVVGQLYEHCLIANLAKLEKYGAAFMTWHLRQTHTQQHSELYVYDTVKNSACLHSVTEDLLAIND